MPKNEKNSGTHIGRRTFLKGVAASAVGVATASFLETCPRNAEAIASARANETVAASSTSAKSTNPSWSIPPVNWWNEVPPQVAVLRAVGGEVGRPNGRCKSGFNRF